MALPADNLLEYLTDGRECARAVYPADTAPISPPEVTMDRRLEPRIADYLKKNPDVQRVLKAFQMSQEEYERAVAAMSLEVPTTEIAATTTTQGSFDANAATASR